MNLSSVAVAIEVLLSEADLKLLVATYFNPEEPFAGHSFDTVGLNPVNGFSEGDLLAITLLDVGFAPRAVRSLLGDPQRWSTLLAAIPTDLDLWRIDQRCYDSSNALWNELLLLPSIGPTKAGKLLARKRPRLIPIFDEVIGTFLAPGELGLWWELHDALQDEDRRQRIDLLGAGLDPKPTTLRLLDVAVWMRCGNSSNARAARQMTGMSADPLVPPRRS